MRITTFFFGFLMLTWQVSCDSGNNGEEVVSKAANVDMSRVEITREQFNIAGMDTGRYVLRSFEKLIRTTGVIDVPPAGKAQVSAYYNGYVLAMNLIPGQHVRKGQILFTLENPEYIEVQQDYLEVKNALPYLKREYERQKELIADNYTSEKNFLKAESDYMVSESIYQSLRKKLEMMRIDPDELDNSTIRTRIDIPAPITGYVTEVNAATGMFLAPGDVAVTLMNSDHLHVELSIYESDRPRVSIGQAIRFKTQTDLSRWYNGEVYLINRIIDENNRTVNIHCHLEDDWSDQNLVPGMFVEAEIITQQDSIPALPEEAVVTDEANSLALVLTGLEGDRYTFEKQEVEIGSLLGGYYPLLNVEAFDPNTIFLVRGAFALKSE